MFETADPVSYDLLKRYAEENKMFMTDAERALWDVLRTKAIGHKFRRQHIIGDYIADFANLHYKVVVEIDGKYHFRGDQPVSDEQRTADLNQMGWTVVRFTNEEVLGDISNVIHQLKKLFQNMEISYATNKKVPPSPTGEGSGERPPQNVPPSPTGEGQGERPHLPYSKAWAVDAACSGNPGAMEYQGVDLQTGAQVFHYGPVYGTNNIGEFLAIVHALALMQKQGITDRAIYSDSYNAILWVQKKQCKTKLPREPRTEQLFQVIARAEAWLRRNAVQVPIIQWQTRQWGDIPADFGRKK